MVTESDKPQTDGRPRPRGDAETEAGVGFGTLSLLLVALVLGAGLLIAGVPQLLAGVETMRAGGTLTAVRDGRDGPTPPAGAVDAAAEYLADADGWFFQGRVAADRGYLLLRKGLDLPAGPERRDALMAAETATRAALRAAPAQPAAWARLAYLRASAGDRTDAERTLRMSLLTGPVAPAMQASRLALGLSLLDEDTAPRDGLAPLLERQVRLAWLVDPFAIVPLAATPGNGAFIRDALAGLTPAEQELYARRQTPSAFVPR